MKVKSVILGTFALVLSSFAFATHHEPNLDGPGALPPNAEPGQCYLHKFVPPKYSHDEVQVVVKEAYKKFTVIPPIFQTSTREVPASDPYSDWDVTDPVFNHVTEKIQIMPSDPVWKVDCCKHKKPCKDRCDHKCKHDRCDHKKHDGDCKDKRHCHGKHQKPCEQACFDYVEPQFKVYKKQITVSDGSAIPKPTQQEQETIEYDELVKDAELVEENFPEELMSVKVYTLDHPGYMKWVEGNCRAH